MATYANNNKKVINQLKCKVINFNSGRRKVQFQPYVQLEGKQIEVVEEVKLVGFSLQSTIKFGKNTQNIIK